MYSVHTYLHMYPSIACTFTFVLLSEYAVHELTAHLTEGGAKEGMLLETMRHVDLETLLQKLCSGRRCICTCTRVKFTVVLCTYVYMYIIIMFTLFRVTIISVISLREERFTCTLVNFIV